MHRLPSSYTLRRFRVASLLVIVMFLMIPVVLGSVLCGVQLVENQWFIIAGIACGVGILCSIVNLILSGRVRCPLCIVPPLQNRKCSRHKSARKLLGSHSLRVAYSIMFTGMFKCPYCGEPTAMEVRQRNPR